MLATPIPYGEAYRRACGDAWFVEDKYDGIRAQAHVTRRHVRALLAPPQRRQPLRIRRSRSACATLRGDAILDGEIVAMRDGRVLPFRTLQARLQRKDVDAELLREVPVAYVVFDLLALGDDLLLDEPLASAPRTARGRSSPSDRASSSRRSSAR